MAVAVVDSYTFIVIISEENESKGISEARGLIDIYTKKLERSNGLFEDKKLIKEGEEEDNANIQNCVVRHFKKALDAQGINNIGLENNSLGQETEDKVLL